MTVPEDLVIIQYKNNLETYFFLQSHYHVTLYLIANKLYFKRKSISPAYLDFKMYDKLSIDIRNIEINVKKFKCSLKEFLLSQAFYIIYEFIAP